MKPLIGDNDPTFPFFGVPAKFLRINEVFIAVLFVDVKVRRRFRVGIRYSFNRQIKALNTVYKAKNP
jgi:hypothetical protein